MMDSGIQAAMGRIEEIRARFGLVGAETPAAPPAPAAPAGSVQPFDALMAQKAGAVAFRPLGGGLFPPAIDGLITQHAAQNGVSADLVRAVIEQESGGNPGARSAAGAMGLMQLMPATAQGYGVTDPFDPAQNVAAGTRHLAGLLDEFGGDVPLTLAAYNAGSGAVKKYGGVPPFAETQNYVRRIMGRLGQR